MPRDTIALTIRDLSAFTRTLRRDLAATDSFPGHLALMNMLARAAGYANFQHLRATPDHLTGDAPDPAPEPDRKLLDAALRVFDSQGRMTRWPTRIPVQKLCVWVLWSHLPPRRTMAEPEVNITIDNWHTFGDRAILRRSLIEHGLATRTPDGRAYRRIESEPPAEVLALLGVLSARSK
ncbi:MAG: DUF2087 domain-containing protein [Paracoccaceae bacterium]